MRSKVSVIIATHNRLDLLSECVRSVTTQSFDDIEVIVADDLGDTAVQTMVCGLDNRGKKIRYINRPFHIDKAGGLVCRNLAMRMSSSDFTLFLDDDDLLAPRCIEDRLKHLDRYSEIDACVGQCALFRTQPNDHGSLWANWSSDQDDLLLFLQSRVPWQTTGPLWRRNALELVGLWDESLVTGWDYEFHVRALAKGVRLHRRDAVDYHWRMPREDSYSGFDRMKEHHRRGFHIEAFIRAIESIGNHGRWTDTYREAAWREAVRLGIVCRVYGGDARTSFRSLKSAFHEGCVSRLRYMEARSALAVWPRVGSIVPSLSYLARRGYRAA